MAKILLPCLLAAMLAAGCSSQPHAASLSERKAEALADAGVEGLQRQDYTLALRSLLEAHKLNPKSAAIVSNLGIAYAGKNEPAKAEECWRKALQLEPNHQDARLNLGVLYMNAKHYPEAERVLKEAAKDLTYAKLDQVAMKLAQIYSIQNRPLLAEQQLKVAVRENPGNCDAWYRLGVIQKERGDYTEAAQSLKGAVKGICYKNPGAHFEMATLLLKAQDVPQAKLKLLEIIQLFPSSEWAARSEATLNMIR